MEWIKEQPKFTKFNGKDYISLPTSEVATIPGIIESGIEFRTFIAIPKLLKFFIKFLITINKEEARKVVR